MIRGLTRGATLVIALMLASAAHASSDFNIIIGQKMLDDDWTPFEDQATFIGQLTIGDDDWPVYLAIDVVTSDDDSMGGDPLTEGQTLEIDVGVRKIWDRGVVRPLVGGGIGRIKGEFKQQNTSFEDATIGVWMDAGVFWRIGQSFNLGIEARISRGSVSIGPDGSSVEAGGEHLGVLVGFGW